MRGTGRALVALLALFISAPAGCGRAPRATAPRDRASALRALARCTFDEASGQDSADFARDASRIESALRRSLRGDRVGYSVRAGRCEGALTPELRASDPAVRELARAWGELLPLAQATRPEDIALERAIRHVGNAWRGAAR